MRQKRDKSKNSSGVTALSAGASVCQTFLMWTHKRYRRGLGNGGKNFSSGHKKSAATLNYKMERSEISTNRKRSQTTTFWRCKIGTRKLLTHAEFAWLRSSQTDLMRQILHCGFTMIRQFQNQEHYAESTLIWECHAFLHFRQRHCADQLPVLICHARLSLHVLVILDIRDIAAQTSNLGRPKHAC